MKQQMVITNLRMPAEDWMRVKATAASWGMSANQYIQTIIDEATKRNFFAYTNKSPAPGKKTRLYESLWKIIEHPTPNKPIKASEEDKVIYGA